MKSPIYLDNNAATFVASEVADAMAHYLRLPSGNPSSVHAYGRKNRALLSSSRASIAHYLGVKPQEIIFSSCGTEALNFCLRGLLANKSPGHLITSNVEHAAVYETVREFEKKGWDVSYLPVGLFGAITKDQLQAAIREDTQLISLIAVNNETGVKTEVSEIAEISERMNIPLLMDGVALLGKGFFTIPRGVTAICFSGQKIHGPTGIGFAYVRSGTRLSPIITGGNQEMGFRGGTENMLGIIGLKAAMDRMQQDLAESTARMAYLRDFLEKQLIELGGVTVNGKGPRICNTSNLCFHRVDGESLLSFLDMAGVAVSHGSACSSGTLEPSRVLLQMGIPIEEVRSSLRFSLSRMTTIAEIEETVAAIRKIIRRIRPVS